MVVIGASGFYKVIVLKVDLMESTIIDERHFPSLEAAKKFRYDTLINSDNTVCVICKM